MNSLLTTVIVQFTTKTTHSKKAIYLLSLMSYSISKLKVYMLFTSKTLVFSNFTHKKSFVPENRDGMGASELSITRSIIS